MKTNIITLVIILLSGLGLAQNKMEKCNKLTETEQKVCKDHVISTIVSDYVEYPESSLFNEQEGTVYVRFATDENQNLKSVRVLGNSDKELAEAAQNAVEHFANAEGKMLLATNEVYRIPVKFELE